MDNFDEKELESLIQEALSTSTSSSSNPFSTLHLGMAETDILESIHKRFSKKVIESEVNEIFQEVRTDILSRKISLTTQDLHTITKNCRKCSIDSDSELPKWNVENPDIVIVIENPSISLESIQLLIDSLKDAGLSSQQLCLTYINRCPVRRKYDNQEIINCSPYLHTELQLLNPKLILCLGALPSSVLFGSEIKLKDIRGNIIWLGYWPILTTYSPSYVIKSSSFESSHVADSFRNDISNAARFVSSNRK